MLMVVRSLETRWMCRLRILRCRSREGQRRAALRLVRGRSRVEEGARTRLGSHSGETCVR